MKLNDRDHAGTWRSSILAEAPRRALKTARRAGVIALAGRQRIRVVGVEGGLSDDVMAMVVPYDVTGPSVPLARPGRCGVSGGAATTAATAFVATPC